MKCCEQSYNKSLVTVLFQLHLHCCLNGIMFYDKRCTLKISLT